MTDGIVNEIKFTDLFNLDEIQSIQDLFADATGIASIITRPDGTPITRPSNFCRLCNDIIRGTEKGRLNCLNSDALIGHPNENGPLIQPCLSCGLWDAGASITLGGKHVANWLIGQVRNKDLDEQKIIHYADEIGVDRSVFMEAFSEVPIMSREQFTKIAKMLFAFTKELSERAFQHKKLEQYVVFQQQAEENVRLSEEKYRRLFERAPVGMFRTGIDGKEVLEVNEKLLQITGYSREQVISNLAKISWRDQTSRDNLLNLLMENGSLQDYEFDIIAQDKSVKTLLGSFGLFKDEGFIEGAITDITGRNQAEKNIARIEFRYRALIENAAEGIVLVSPEGKFLFASPPALRMFGFAAEELSNERPDALTHPDDLPLVLETMGKLLHQPQKVLTMPYRFMHKDGRWIWIESTFSNLLTLEGVEAIVINFRDISFRREAELALIENEKKFRLLAENSADVIWILNTEGKFTFVSPSVEKLRGYTPSEVLLQSAQEALTPESAKLVQATILDAIDKISRGITNPEPVPVELEQTCKDGSTVWTEALVQPLFESTGNHIGYLGVTRNITERKRTEKIQEIQYNIASAVVTSKDLEELLEIVQLELSQVIDTTNFFVAYYNQEKDTLSKVFWADQKDEYTEWKADDSLSGQVIRKKQTLLLNRMQIQELATLNKLELLGTKAESWLGVPLWLGDQVAGVMVVQSYDNINAFNKSSAGLLELIAHELSIFIEKKRTQDELVKAKNRAEESDRLKSTFLANMSHEIRTPMNAIVGFASMIADPGISEEERTRFAGIIQSRSDDLMHIINDLLEISRIESGNATVVKSKVVMNEILDDLESEFRHRLIAYKKNMLSLSIQKSMDADQSTIITDAYILKQVYSNLIDNAIKYTNAGSVHAGYYPPENGIIKCFVKDTGIGISVENKTIIFEHFRQADIPDPHLYGGTGLGLAICKGCLDLLGGSIWVESTEGAGSTFYFTIPYEHPARVNSGKQVKAGPAVKKEGHSWIGKRLLIVEDEPTNMEFLRIILMKTGAEVLGVETGMKLRKQFDKLDQFDLVLLDMRLPDADGWELAREIKAIRSDLPVIAQTAYAMSTDRLKSEQASCDNYISKPINKNILLRMLAAHLDNKTSHA